MKGIYFSVLLITIFSCATDKNLNSNKETLEISKSIQNKVIKATLGEKKSISAAFQITGVSINANIMTIDVNYSGGCDVHSFEMIGSLMMAKSLPPIRTIHLIHISNEDKCEKLIKEKILVDISDLSFKKEKGNEIFLTLEGWPEKIKYIYE